MVGVEFGIPFDIANTLTNPLGNMIGSDNMDKLSQSSEAIDK